MLQVYDIPLNKGSLVTYCLHMTRDFWGHIGFGVVPVPVAIVVVVASHLHQHWHDYILFLYCLYAIRQC